MRKSIITAFLIPFLISGCAQKLWYGQNPRGDSFECEREANSRFPQNMQTQTYGSGYTTPIYTTCNFGSCVSTGGNYVPPVKVTNDINSSSRREYYKYCMESKGNVLMTEDEYKKSISRKSSSNNTSQATQTKKRNYDSLSESCFQESHEDYNQIYCEMYRRASKK